MHLATTEKPTPKGRVANKPSRPRYKPSLTADVNVIERACEMHHPTTSRLFTDPFARHFMQSRVGRVLAAWGPLARVALRVYDHLYAGNHAHVVLRNRLYEHELRRALADGIDQVVLLGAGYELDGVSPRPQRSDALRCGHVAHTHRAKLRAAEHARLEAKSTVVYVDCDFRERAPVELPSSARLRPVAPLAVHLAGCHLLPHWQSSRANSGRDRCAHRVGQPPRVRLRRHHRDRQHDASPRRASFLRKPGSGATSHSASGSPLRPPKNS